MYQRLTALKRQITNAAPVQDRQCAGECAGIDVARRARQRLVTGKAAEVACRVADVGDGKVADGRQDESRHFSDCTPVMAVACANYLLVDWIADDRAGHAVPATAAAPEFGARDCYDFDAFLAQ